MSDEFAMLDAVGQAELVRTGQVQALELIDAAIARIERLNPDLNAVIHPRFERARAEAQRARIDAPLSGVPMVVKDFDGFLADEPFHAGMRALRERGFVAPHDSYLMSKFKQAGLIVVGKTNTPELGLLPTTEPEAYGPTRNPWDTARSTGGSSGGSAATVASRLVALGHAGDGGGSIRIPASECGLVGLLPSRGRHSLGPEVGESWGGLVRRLVVSRSVRDTAVVLDAVAGYMPGDPYTAPPPVRPYVEELAADPGRLRVGFTSVAPDPAVTTHPDCIAAVEAAAALLGSLGHDVEPARPEVWDDADYLAGFVGHFLNAYGVWTAAEIDRLSRLSGSPITADGVEPATWAIQEMGRSITAQQYFDAIGAMHDYARRMAKFWSGGYDLLLTPTIPEPPPPLGQFGSTTDNPLSGVLRAASIVAFTAPFNTTGQPAISLPLHWNDDGLPIGVQLVAAYGREDLLIQVASQLEQAKPWSDRLPGVHA